MQRSLFQCAIILFALCCALPIFNASAQSMHGEPELIMAEPYSEPYAGKALWFDKWFEDLGPYHSSAVRLNKCWAITAGHSVFTNGYYSHTNEVGNGSNSLIDRGVVREIEEVIIHPTWEAGGGVWDGQRVDLALLRFAQPLNGQNVSIAPVILDEVMEYAGFGQPATPGVGLLPYDGERRAWDARAEEFGFSYISDKYVKSRFWSPAFPEHLAMGAIGTGGSSGSGGFNEIGKLVSLAVFQVGAPNYLGSTYGLRLDLYKSWIQSYTNDLSCDTSPPIYHLAKSDKVHSLTTVAHCRVGHSC